jgi:hypothetical protein
VTALAKADRVRASEVDVDLDALRKAHADGKRTKSFRLGGEVFEVAGKLPVYVAVLLGEGELRDALSLWLGEEQERRFASLGITAEELQELLRTLYAVAPGESAASPTR